MGAAVQHADCEMNQDDRRQGPVSAVPHPTHLPYLPHVPHLPCPHTRKTTKGPGL